MKKAIIIIMVLISAGLTAQLPQNLDEVVPFHEGLAAIRVGNEWAFIDDLGTIVIDFRDDIHWNPNAQESDEGVMGVKYPYFSDGRCIVKKEVDGIPFYGFIDTKGTLIIEYEFLNVRPFENGYTTGILFDKVYRGQNEFKLDIYDYKFHEVLMDVDGNMLDFMNRRYNIQLKKSRYKLPRIESKLLSENLITYKKDGAWELKKLDF
jgi:hypothetical protein